MKKSTIITLSIVGAIVAAFVLTVILTVGSYNGFVTKSEDVDKAYSQIENQLQRRNDLIPNLVSTVQGYASHENEVFTAIADARAEMLSAKTTSEKAQADVQVTTALRGLLGYTENYPELKADKQFTQLMDELAGTENRLSVERKNYNDVAAEYNKKVKKVPGALVANIFGFDEKELFKAEEGAKEVPKVDFGSGK